MIPYQVTRSDSAGATMLPNFFATHLAAMEAALATISLDAAKVLMDGGDGKITLQRDGDFARLLIGDKPFVVYHVQRVELENAETEEIVFTTDLW